MSWKRGEKSTDFELSRVQDWIEEKDVMLSNIQTSVDDIKTWMKIRIDREDQRDKQQARRDVWHNLALVAIGLVLTLLLVLEGVKSAKDHGFTFPHIPKIFHSQKADPMYAKQSAYY